MRKFKTESKKLLDLMINSIYTNKEIFLRELISNASDAVDKLYFKSLTDTDVKLSKDDLRILISTDEEARTLTVSDTGIGMSDEELEKNLSTIAHSGSLDFKQENADEQGGDVDIIGQFGVGFYSAFMVASKIDVITKPYGSDQAWKWSSTGVEGYTIEPSEKESHGTDVILTLKPDSDEEEYSRFLQKSEIEQLVKKYSNYVRYPIQMEEQLQRALPKPEDAGDDYVTQYEDYTETQTLNSMIPIWKRAKKDVTDEEYNDFYKLTFHDFEDPAKVISLKAEGTLSYQALLFIPSRQPFDFWSKDYKKGLALYSSGVMIMEKCEDLVPDCFNFVRGVVDSQDLSLNISRETLQQDRQLRAMERRIEKKIKSELADMRDKEREDYEKFFENFGRTLKFGIYSSYGQQAELLSDLLLFYSAKQQKMVTLDEYLDGCGDQQKSIYYAAGDSRDLLSKMPIVKTVLSKGYDVLLCTEDVDEFCLSTLRQYKEKDFKNVASGDLDLETEEEKKLAQDVTEQNTELFEAMQQALGDAVTKVAVSTRLTDEPVCLTAAGPVSLEMEKILSEGPGNEGVKSERVLEINPNHQIFKTLQTAQSLGDTEKVSKYSKLLYDQALLIEGMDIDDPVEFAKSVCELMK